MCHIHRRPDAMHNNILRIMTFITYICRVTPLYKNLKISA